MTEYRNLSTDSSMGGNSPSDYIVSSQKAIKTYVDNHGGGGYHPNIFDVKWADHICNDVQWLRADTFSWQSGAVYEAAFVHLRNDMFVRTDWTDGGTFVYTKNRFPFIGEPVYSDSSLTTQIGTVSAYDGQITVNGTQYHYNYALPETQQTETIAGTTITYYLADDGHKIVLANQESNVAAIFAATGAAWYYIIDTTNERFKLPRTSPQLRYVTERLNIDYTNPIQISNGDTSTVYGWFYISGHSYNGQETVALNGTTVYWGGNAGSERLSGDCILWVKPGDVITWSTWNGQVAMSRIYPAKYPETAEPGDKYLYFYVGNFTQTALENTAGINAELFNDKADIDLNNVSAGIDFVVESQLPSAGNNYTWYRKYKSGWVEQGGRATCVSVADGSGTAGNNTINLPITMKNGEYQFSANTGVGGSGWSYANGVILNASNTTYIRFKVVAGTSSDVKLFWRVWGIAA